MGSEIIDFKPKNGNAPPPLPPPQQDMSKRWIRIDLDLLTKRESISGYIQDKNLAIKMLTDAIRMINNMGTAPVPPPTPPAQEGHA